MLVELILRNVHVWQGDCRGKCNGEQQFGFVEFPWQILAGLGKYREGKNILKLVITYGLK